jgi:hypothetical protein
VVRDQREDVRFVVDHEDALSRGWRTFRRRIRGHGSDVVAVVAHAW